MKKLRSVCLTLIVFLSVLTCSLFLGSCGDREDSQYSPVSPETSQSSSDGQVEGDVESSGGETSGDQSSEENQDSSGSGKDYYGPNV